MISLLLTFFCTVLKAAEPGSEKNNILFSLVQKRYADLQSLKLNFDQELTNAASHETEHRSGVIFFKKPHQIRWEVLKPEKELLVISKGLVWDVYPEDKTAYKFYLEQKFNSKKLIKIITGQINLNKEFNMLSITEEQGLKKIKMVPITPEPDLVLAYVWVNDQNGLIKKILLVDFYGNGNQIEFKNIAIDSEMQTSIFEFELPQNYHLIDNTHQ